MSVIVVDGLSAQVVVLVKKVGARKLMKKKIDKKKYKKALDFAYKIHFKQNRKGTGMPYFTHLVSVSNNFIENDGSIDEVIV